MGLFDQLKKGALDDLKDKLEKATGVDLDEIADNLTKQAAEEEARQAEAKKEEAAAREASVAAGTTDVKKRFEDILSSSFSAYTVKSGVSADELGLKTAGVCKPYDFVLYKGGKPAGVIMLTPHNRDNNAAFRNAKAAAGSKVPFINFYTHMNNEEGYVIKRIKSFL